MNPFYKYHRLVSKIRKIWYLKTFMPKKFDAFKHRVTFRIRQQQKIYFDHSVHGNLCQMKFHLAVFSVCVSSLQDLIMTSLKEIESLSIKFIVMHFIMTVICILINSVFLLLFYQELFSCPHGKFTLIRFGCKNIFFLTISLCWIN